MGSVLLSSPFASGSRTAWCGLEHYNLPVHQGAPCSGDLSDFQLPAQHRSGQLHVLSTPPHPAICHLSLLCLLFPGPQYPSPSLCLCISDHLSSPNSNPAFSLSLSNYSGHPHCPWVVTSPSLKSCPNYNMCSNSAFSGIVPKCFKFVCLFPC